MIFEKYIGSLIKISILNFLSIFYTLPKLLCISLFEKKYINLAFSNSKLIKRNNIYRVNLNFDSELIWNPLIPLPFLGKKVKKIYSINFLDKLSLEHIERHIQYCRKNLLIDEGEYFLSVKDSSFYLEAYTKNNFSLFCQLINESKLSKYGVIDQINYLIREGNRTLFDEEFIRNLFQKNGFRKIIKREFNYSIDLPQSFHDSIYILAKK